MNKKKSQRGEVYNDDEYIAMLNRKINKLEEKMDKIMEYCENNIEFCPRLQDIREIINNEEGEY